MRNTLDTQRRVTRTLVVAAIAGGVALGLTACQTAAQDDASTPVVATQSGPAAPGNGDQYAGRPADRVAEEIERQVRAGQLPSSACQRHALVEHPRDGFHLVCTVPAPTE